MNTRNTLLGAAVVLLLAGGAWWWLQPAAPADVKVAVAVTPKVSAPAVPPKAVVEAPKAPAVVASANANVAEAAVAKPATDADLKSAVEDLITTLEAPDPGAFVQNFMAPAMLQAVMDAAYRRTLADLSPDTTPEARAQIEQVLQKQMGQQMQQQTQQRLPQMVQQLTQGLTQNPDAWKNLQKMGEAFKRVPNILPVMNDTGNLATYTLGVNDDPKVPTNLVMVLRNGKWTFDMGKTMMSSANNGHAQ